jgi:predicted DNA-binding helix-hairpin-helix protein
MDEIIRLKTLSEQMSFEPAEEHSQTGSVYLDKTDNCPDSVFVHPAVLPNGQKIKLLKTLLSSACERDCFYCPFRAGRDMRR